MTALGIIQARMASTRLPGKILAPIGGVPLLRVLLDRIRGAAVDQWWLATTDSPTDDVTHAWADEVGLPVFRGHPDDVLSRFTGILRARRAIPDWVVRITADDPFVDARVIDLLLEQASQMPERLSVISESVSHRTLPLGYVPQVARADRVLALEAQIPAGQEYHRSHVLSVFYQRDEAGVFAPPALWVPRPDWRWTVDTPLDLEMARGAFELFGNRWASIGYPDMERLMSANTDVAVLNAGATQKALQEG